MSQKKNKRLDGIVYSTNPDFFSSDEEQENLPQTPQPDQQKLRVTMEKKGRGGKTVTLVLGFVGTDEELETLGKLLKTKCGVGGSVKDGEIVLQGDFKTRIAETLKGMGYVKTKVG